MASVGYERVLKEAESLARQDQLLLVERLIARLGASERAAKPRVRWEDLAGSAPYPLCGEDAQQWVTRTRQESDERRSVP
jgi:hypothetical protein